MNLFTFVLIDGSLNQLNPHPCSEIFPRTVIRKPQSRGRGDAKVNRVICDHMELKKKKRKKKKRRALLGISAILLLIVLLAGFYIHSLLFASIKLKDTLYIYIDQETSYQQVVDQLQKNGAVPSEKIFHLLAQRMNYPDRVKSGRYAITDGMTMPDVIRLLRSGVQTPVNLTFNNIRTAEQLAGRISQQLMLDSLSLLSSLNDSLNADAMGFRKSTFITMFIPNTYEVYWNISSDNLLRRMKKEYDTFWNNKRRKQAEEIGLTPQQVAILASIVEEEATYGDEYPVVAGLYLNRLEKGMRLEADPTVKYAVGDFSLRRILFSHLEVESPYNTYINSGLPPGPIRIPSIKAIEGTLSPAEHRYLFMCAKEDLSGRHNFAVTHAQHARNARAYQSALNEKGIY